MAMRPRGGGAAAPRRGGARSGVVRPVYEDFRPGSEWQHDDDSHILTISLPGFMKEQIRVSTEGHNTIRVRGERLVAGNKWNRFQEDFQVPDNGEMNSVRAKFQGGTLTITVPKVKVTLSPKTERIDDVQKQPTPHKGQEKEADTSQATDEKATETTKTLMDAGMKQGQDGDRKQPTSEKSRDEDLPAIDTRKTTDEKSSEPEKTSSDSKTEHDQGGDHRGRSFTPLKNIKVSPDNVQNENIKSKEEHIASERLHDDRNTTEDTEGKEKIANKELPDAEEENRKILEKDRARDVPENNPDNKKSHEAFSSDKYKAAVKGLTELNEERQLLVNMGAAMLVIVALTAYVTYSFVSAKDKN